MYNHLKELRNDKDLNQKEMSEIISVAQTTYSDYELGKINIPIPILKRLAEYFETSIDYLVDFTDKKEPYPRIKARRK